MRGGRRSGPVFAAFGVLALIGAGELLHAALSAGATTARLDREGAIVRALGLTDPALFTEARYTRNPTLADLNTPFQDHPMALDHFPSGAIVPAPTPPGNGWVGFDPKEANMQGADR